jgi:hypothetical protein
MKIIVTGGSEYPQLVLDLDKKLNPYKSITLFLEIQV